MRPLAIAMAVAIVALMIPPAFRASANALPYYWLPWTAGESRDVTQGNGEGQGTVRLNDRNSNFVAGFQQPVFTWGEVPGVGDFNGDGYDDAITFNQQNHAYVSLVTLTENGLDFGDSFDWGVVFTWGEILGGFQTFAYEVIFDAWFSNAHDPPLWYPPN